MKHLLLLIVICGIYSCSGENDSLNPSSSGDCAVNFSSATVGVEASTRSTTTYLPKDSNVTVAAYLNGTGTATTKKYKVSDAAGTLASTDGQNLLLWGNRSYTFYQYNPSLSFKGSSTDSLKISQGMDFLLDSLTTTLGTAISQTLTLPSLNHRCSYLEFDTQSDASNTVITSVSIGANGLSLSGLTATPQTYKLGKGFNLSSAALTGTATIAQSSFTGSSNVYSGSAIVLPKASGSVGLSIDCWINSTRYTLSATIPSMVFASGTKYVFTVDFKDCVITLKLSTQSWTSISSTVTMGAGTVITVGSWSVNSSTAAMGAGSVISVNGWSTNSTSTTMGS